MQVPQRDRAACSVATAQARTVSRGTVSGAYQMVVSPVADTVTTLRASGAVSPLQP